jgi:hypothetical protein
MVHTNLFCCAASHYEEQFPEQLWQYLDRESLFSMGNSYFINQFGATNPDLLLFATL